MFTVPVVVRISTTPEAYATGAAGDSCPLISTAVAVYIINAGPEALADILSVPGGATLAPIVAWTKLQLVALTNVNTFAKCAGCVIFICEPFCENFRRASSDAR